MKGKRKKSKYPVLPDRRARKLRIWRAVLEGGCRNYDMENPEDADAIAKIAVSYSRALNAEQAGIRRQGTKLTPEARELEARILSEMKPLIDSLGRAAVIERTIKRFSDEGRRSFSESTVDKLLRRRR